MAGMPRRAGPAIRIACLALASLAAPRLASTGRAATFTVNTTADVVDAAPGDGACATATGACSLRGAIQESRALAGDDTIVLPSGLYLLTIAGASNNSATSGDLDVSEGLTILGAGARTTIIDGNRLDRVFDVRNPVPVTISGVTIRNGAAPGATGGGGIAAVNGPLTLTDVTLVGNSAGGNGGAISASGTTVMTGVAVIGNSAGDGGGGMIITSATLTLTNVTISGNTAAGDGGGLQAANVTASLTNVTITNNSADAGGGIFRIVGSVTLKNTIVADNAPGGNCSDTVASMGNNLDSENSCGLGGAGDLINTDPMLGSLQNNGGPTDTHALPAGSPAVDAGTNAGCPATDQRGTARPFDGDGNGTPTCDIGAFEFNVPPPASADLSLGMTVDNAAPTVGDTVTFTLTVTNAGPDDATGVAVTDLLPAGYTFVGDSGSGSYDSGTGVWTVGTVNAGTSRSHVITATVNPAGPYTNAAQVTAANEIDPDSAPANGVGNGEDDEATVAISPVGTADLSLSKVVDNPTPNIGGTVVFTLTVSNAGPSAATGVTVHDVLPAGYTFVGDSGSGSYNGGTGVWTVGTVSAGGSLSHAITATVNPTGLYTNAAQITGAGENDPDSTPNNGVGNGEDDEASLATAPLGTADLSLSQVVDNPSPAYGATVTFTLTLANAGPSAATGVAVTDLLPAGYTYAGDSGGGAYDSLTGLWTVGMVNAGASASLDLTATVNPAGPYVNGAEVTAASEFDPDSTPGNGVGNGEDDQASQSVTPAAVQAIALAKAATRREVTAGGLADYLMTAENLTGGALAGLTVSDRIPAGFKLVPGSARLARAGPDGLVGTADDLIAPVGESGARPVDFGPFDLAAGETVQIFYVLRVGAGVFPGEHANRATPYQGAVPMGRTAGATVQVVPDPAFDLSTIIGKVFRDANRNGRQDPDEPGVPGAIVALDDGTYALTDGQGRYHFPAASPGQRLVKINRHSLPPGAEIVTDASRVLWVTPGLIARASFGVLWKTERETIGRPGEPGLAVSGEARERPIEVLGSVEALSALVNGRRVPFPSADVQLLVVGADDIVELGGSGLAAPIQFGVQVDAKSKVSAWTLTILDEHGTPFRSFRGDGAPRRKIVWDGRSDSGDLVAGGGIYEYQLDLRYADGSRGASARRLLGVNRSRRISLRLMGDAFLTGKAELSDKAKQALDQAFAALQDLHDERIVIEGYTDSVGSRSFNRELSRRRAEAAAAYLHDTLGVVADRIVAVGYGPDRPIASNQTPAGRSMNRRVEISVEAKKVTRARVRDTYQAPPAVQVNGAPVEVGRDGRFAARIPSEGADRLTVAMADREGRQVEASVPLPRLAIISPVGRRVLKFGASDDVCRAAVAGLRRDSKEVPPAATCRFRGSTEPGNRVELDGAPLKVAADGTFAADLDLPPGETVFGVLVRDRQGHTRIASLVVTVADRDQNGVAVIAEQGIPHLAIDLPPADAVLTSNVLGLAGRTNPGSRVAVNGRGLEVGRDGTFAGAVELPAGAGRLLVEVTDAQGRVGRIERDVQVGPPPLFLMALADGTIGRLKGDGFIEAAGLEEERGSLLEGRVAVYLKGTVAGKYLIAAAYDSDRGEASSIFGDLGVQDERRLLTNLDPDKFYPVYGDDSTVVYDAQGRGKLYLALEGDAIRALYGNYPLSLTDTELAAYQRTLHGGRFVYESPARTIYGAPETRVVLFEAEVRQTHFRDELRATGGSLYYLSQQNVVEGSEEVTLVVRDKNTGLTLSRERQRPGLDYTIKYEEGRLSFQRAIGSVAPSDSPVDAQLLSGHPVFVQVDYEALVGAFEKTSYGARARRQLGDHLAVGATYVEDELGAGPYELRGLDAEVRLGRGSRITAEVAESAGADSVSAVSDDGGLSYASIPTTGLEEGTAVKVAADLDVGEWLGRPGRFRLRGYVKEIDPGFFSNGNLREQGTDKSGASATWTIGATDTLHLRRDREERTGAVPAGGEAETTVSSAQWDRRRERWGVGVELLESEARDDAGGLLRRSRLGAARFWSKLSEKLLARLERQETLDGPANDQTTVDLQYAVARSLALTARGTHGSLGSSVEAGAVLSAGDGRIYVTERALDDRAGERTATVVGARAPLGPDSRVYSEYQWEEGEAGRRKVSLLGVQRQWDVGPGFRLILGGEAADVAGGALISRRSAATASLSYANDRGLTAVTRQQVRFESGTTPREQILSVTRIDYRVRPSITLLGNFRYSRTTERDTDEVEARLEERGFGFAYRPVTHDRFNALARYTRVLDLRPFAGSPLESTERILDVIALDTTCDLTRRLEWLSKIAWRGQEERRDGVRPARSRARLAIQRLNLEVWKPIALGVEYRVLDQRDTDDRRQGWLTEVLWAVHDNFRIGGGFNFTDFSDDAFSANDYSVRGWFLRVQGRY
jgi:uncharacterized repeat protein (TIGR01451 family)/CSLREA domain-containing protein